MWSKNMKVYHKDASFIKDFFFEWVYESCVTYTIRMDHRDINWLGIIFQAFFMKITILCFPLSHVFSF